MFSAGTILSTNRTAPTMSNRQMRRLRKQLMEQEVTHSGEADDDTDDGASSGLEEPAETAKGPSAFAAFNDSSSEASSSEEDTSVSKPTWNPRPSMNPTPAHVQRDHNDDDDDDDDDALLDQAIAQSKEERLVVDTDASAKGAGEGVMMGSVFDVNEADLNSDNEVMKQLQAVGQGKEGEGRLSRGGGRNKRKTARATFCTPEKDWAPLPSFVSGAGVARQIW